LDALTESSGHIYDELLVLRSQGGDATAFEELVGRWQERLWRHAWRMTGDHDAAWDVLQEAWMGISRGLRRLEDPAAFGAWVYRIVSNHCGSWLRRERRRGRADRAYAEAIDRNADRDDETTERCADLNEALSRLSGRDRAILSLRYYDRFNTAEIAAIVDVPEGTVKSRLHYARKRLRAMLEESDDE
jgi:RNA polymerase sigma-70 factor (ECF subfamily)